MKGILFSIMNNFCQGDSSLHFVSLRMTGTDMDREGEKWRLQPPFFPLSSNLPGSDVIPNVVRDLLQKYRIISQT
jgi:hypothetical protein